jgi:protein-L-isoaspartate(D-aspartate) O-methyltransferase
MFVGLPHRRQADNLHANPAKICLPSLIPVNKRSRVMRKYCFKSAGRMPYEWPAQIAMRETWMVAADPQMKNKRNAMVRRQVEARGVTSPDVLDAMRAVPREAFLPEHMREFAYEDAPLPIDEGQTISQPYIVAFMTEALGLQRGETVLEIGTGSGYAAAVLAEIAGQVYTVERFSQLAQKAAAVLSELGNHNIHVLHADGSLGWPEHAPYDAIAVAAGGPAVPQSLKSQLKIGGRLVIPIGTDTCAQELVRVTRISENEWTNEDLADVRFVPLIGEEGWNESPPPPVSRRPKARDDDLPVIDDIAHAAEPFSTITSAPIDRLLERIGDAHVVLLGEASHGTSQFYRMRDRITRALIAQKGFNIVAVEADWPDAARIDHYVRHAEYAPSDWKAFARFPTWMWRNTDMRDFVDWLAAHNAGLDPERRVGFYGLDLYSMYNSIRAVLDYLEEVDPDSARVARERYGCLTPWQSDPATYGHAALTGAYHTCENEVVRMLGDLLRRPACRQRRTLLPHHVLRLARLVESARRPYVRNP